MAQGANSDSKVIWMEGKFIPYDQAQVHVLSHSLHYGCAVFEGLRAYETKDGRTAMFQPVPHFQRFFDSMKVLGYSSTYSISQCIEAAEELIRVNGFKECYVRPLAYINDTVRGLKLPPKPEVLIAIAVWPWGKYMGDDGAAKGVRVKVCSLRRPDISTALSFAKLSGNYLTSVLARREATLDGYDEALLMDQEGYVAEGSGENLFVVKGGKILTPPSGSILPGITRQCAIDIARHHGFEVVEQQIVRNQLYIADEVFFTGTAVEVTPIREIDRYTIADGKPGPITKRISETFFGAARGEVPEFKSWLKYV
jgi:branched-chain amino acid aminotransferase